MCTKYSAPIAFFLIPTLLSAENTAQSEQQPAVTTSLSVHQEQLTTKKAFDPFTAKVTKQRVRLRLAPHLDSHVYKELDKEELLLITGEVDDFFSVQPPKELVGYVFRTYVLDGVVEGSHVNVRLEPDLAAPVLCQLNTGDKVHGTIAKNNKWMQIALPEEVQFYVAKEFITKIGDKELFTALEKKKELLTSSLDMLETTIQHELQKPFMAMQVSPIASKLQEITREECFPFHAERAKELLRKMQEAYLEKSCGAVLPESHEQAMTAAELVEPTTVKSALHWEKKERAFLEEALDSRQATSEDHFYKQDLKKAVTLRGVLKPYNQIVPNRPGDYMLVNEMGLPIAYLYSTRCDMNKYLDKEVTCVAADRPNNFFAFKAYFVYEIQ